MNRNLHSPTKLTEFARNFDEEPETFFTKFVNKLTNAYNNNYNNGTLLPPLSPTKPPTIFETTEAMTSSTSLTQQAILTPTSSTTINTDLKVKKSPSRSNSTNSLNKQQIDEEKSTSTSPTSGSISNDDDKINYHQDSLSIDSREERTPNNVLKRLSNLIALKNNNLSNYKDTELQRFWMPDSKSKECYECSQKFSTFRRKHHCRLCGQIFCSKCCNQVVPGKIIKCSGDLKVCTYCSKIVLTYLKTTDTTTDQNSDLKALQDDLSNKFSLTMGNSCDVNVVEPTHNLSLQRKISLGYQEERLVSNPNTGLTNADRKTILQQSNSLKTLHEEMTKLLPQQNKGSELITFLITNEKSSNKIQAIAILNAIIEAGFLIPVTNSFVQSSSNTGHGASTQSGTSGTTAIQQASTSDESDSVFIEFSENVIYKLMRRDDAMSHSGSYQLDLNFESNSVHLSRASHEATAVRHPSSLADDGISSGDQENSITYTTAKDFELQNNLLSTAGSRPLLEAFCEHEELLLSQLLRKENLDLSWIKTLIPLCARMANTLRPVQCGTDLMDIRNFVNFKKVPGGVRNESSIIGGVIFSKNVIHKDMLTRIVKPRILLLQCAIVYQRVEGKFVTIESVLLQEKEYLRNVTARILSLKPNVVLVHKNVAGIAQDMLRSHGITVVLDVKLSVLERLARCLKCDIVSSIDSNIGRPKLGTCDLFYIKNYSDDTGVNKTLMFFETPSSPRGCCVLLRGGNNQELARVKKVAAFLLFARYNWRLEVSFLLDEFARPPSPKPSIFDSKEHSPCDTLQENLDTDNRILIEDIPRQESDNNENKCSDSASIKKFPKIEKKSDEKVINKENVHDFSDPLRATDLSPSIFKPQNSVEFAVETPYDNRFRTALSSTVLSVSPFIAFPLPFLETESGRKCVLRSHFPNELFYSKQWSTNVEKPIQHEVMLPKSDLKLYSEHLFMTQKVTTSADSREFQSILASFRAAGGRYPKTKTMKLKTKKIDINSLVHHHIEDYVYKDALDLDNHQRLPVLFCSYYYNPKAPSTFCAQPSLLNMQFYGQNDIMLGSFLERYCFRSSYICPSCNLPMLNHIRRYVHSMGCIQVKLTEDTNKNNNDTIVMTSWCSICNKATPSVPMSNDTWCFSFAKYLELRFHGHSYKRRIIDCDYEREFLDSSAQGIANNNNNIIHPDNSRNCTHSLHRDHVQYFAYNGIIASFMYTPIDIWEIGLPPLILQMKNSLKITKQAKEEELKTFALSGYDVYAKIYEKLANLSSDTEFPMLSCLKKLLNDDQLSFRLGVEIVQKYLSEPTLNPYNIHDAMFLVKRTLAESIESWGIRLHDAAIQSRNISVIKHDVNNLNIDAGQICTEDLNPESPDLIKEEKLSAEQQKKIISIDDLNLSEVQSITNENIEKIPVQNPINDPIEQNPIIKHQKSEEMLLKQNNSETESTTSIISGTSSNKNKEISEKKSVKQLFSQLLPSTSNINLLQSPLSINEHYTLPKSIFPICVQDQDLSSIIAYTLISNDYKKDYDNLCTGSDATVLGNSSPNLKRKSQDGSIDSDNDREPTQNNEKKIKSKSHLEIHFQDSTTQFICKIYFAREFDEMRSNFLKASTNNHDNNDNGINNKLKDFDLMQQQQNTDNDLNNEKKLTRHSLTNDVHINEQHLRIKRFNSEIINVDKNLFDRKLSNQNLQQLNNTAGLPVSTSGTASTVTATTASSAVHKSTEDILQNPVTNNQIIDGDEIRKAFVRSLSSSVCWEARGGKSGSKFSKTMDDRFVLKEMSKQDVAIFENFAPNYFDYVKQCLQLNQPTLLAKIFGVYRVTIKKKDSLSEKSILVMENLFCDKNISNKFDLKGSDRNRLVDPNNQNGEIVLLDENLIQMSWSKPLYILTHSKTILKEAIIRDSSFLERNDVMDYSLLVGLDSDKKLLVLGIIDYIRTFTFDKRLESIVKKSGILGGQGKLPTVISPKLYKQRFSEAMERYFLTVPDRWNGLSKK